MVLLSVLDVVLVVLGGAGMLYQAVCIVISLFAKPIKFPDAPMDKRYAVLISARNEANVIGNLINCLHEQTYPSELVDIWLVADNCTDNTAEVARNMGCHVIERFNKEQVGKGYALTYLLDRMNESGASDPYDAFFVFDADNKLDKHYLEEMNKGFQAGFKILTSYRNSVNLSDNWVSSGSALWFIRESRFVSASRMWLGNSCHVGGTGFMFSQEIMRRNNGWKFHLLTEDLEFTMDSVLHGDRIGYCGTAILYDEQPVTFAQSWRQRLRWSKGFYQVDAKYTGALLRGCTRGGKAGMSCYDMLMTVAPCNLVTIGSLLLAVLLCVTSFAQPAYITYRVMRMLGRILMLTVRGITFSLFAFGAVTMIAEWKRIAGPAWKKVLYTFTFPFFMLTYVPISIAALVGKVEWKPIQHGIAKVQEERESA